MDQQTAPASLAENERQTILKIYGMLGLMIVFGFIPNIVFCALALVMFGLMMPVARHFRRKAGPDSLIASHMTWIIRTVWIVTLMALVLLAIATAYILSVYNISPLQPCTDNMLAALEAGKEPGFGLVLPCVEPFMDANRHIFLIAGFGVGVPVVLYLLLRLAKGLASARRGEPLRDPRRWL
jgi:uncharacterized membrane protein